MPTATRVVARPPAGPAEDRVPDGEAKQPQEGDDEQRHEERVPPIGGDLLVEGVPGHGPFRGRAPQLRLRSTFGTAAASGSASKNSRLAKPNGPASSTFGKVAMAVL